MSTSTSPSTTAFPCRQCGGKLQFAPGQNALECPYCGARNALGEAAAEVVRAATEELDFEAYLARVAGESPQLERQSVKCPSCAAETQLEANVVADRCAFCATPLLAARAYATRTLRPGAVAPFEVRDGDARARFKAWLAGLWFAPNALRRLARAERGLRGCYLPYWTYDAQTRTPYEGARGDRYFETEHYVENGERKTRQVQRVAWTPVSGAVAVAFDDVLVPATRAVPAQHLDALGPWRLGALQPYRDEFTAGFVVEAYSIDLPAGFTDARHRMDGPIREAVRRDIGGDEQRIDAMTPHFFDVRFKHVLLPLWISSYQYGGRSWRFVVNGQTGAVWGERPYSTAKIALAVAAGLIVVALILWAAIAG